MQANHGGRALGWGYAHAHQRRGEEITARAPHPGEGCLVEWLVAPTSSAIGHAREPSPLEVDLIGDLGIMSPTRNAGVEEGSQIGGLGDNSRERMSEKVV